MTGTALLSAHSLRLRYLPTKKRNFVAKKFMDKGLVGTTLRYPYEVRDTKDYFDDIPDMKLPKDMLQLAEHILETKAGDFEPESSRIATRMPLSR